MNLARFFLILGSVASLLLAGLHLILVFRPQGWSYFGANELTLLAEQDSQWIAPTAFGLTLLFTIWGVYALSGAGVIKQLPFLPTVLIVISIIYILRGLALPFDLIKVFVGTQSFRFAIFSFGSLIAGIFYLVGVLARQGSY